MRPLNGIKRQTTRRFWVGFVISYFWLLSGRPTAVNGSKIYFQVDLRFISVSIQSIEASTRNTLDLYYQDFRNTIIILGICNKNSITNR